MHYLILFFIVSGAYAVTDNMRSCMSNLFNRSGMSNQEQEFLRRSQGQSALDRQYRGFLQRARPAVYDKHTKARNVSEARTMSQRGAAQFMPGLIRERIEARALRELPGVYKSHSGAVYKYVKFDKSVGFDSGRETSWMRVEVSASGEFHGHPMIPPRLYQQCPECEQIDR